MQLPIMPSMRLDGKRAIVTGAGRGIGIAISAALAAAGAHIIMVARSSGELDIGVNAIQAAGGTAEALVLDVTDTEAVEEALASKPTADILVNNAGTNRPKPMSQVSAEDYDAVMGLNVRAAFFLAKVFADRLVAEDRPGSIINMSSQMGHVGAANRTLYCTSKWAIEGLTKAMAVEYGPSGVRVNTICPTFIETPMTKSFFEDEAFKSSVLQKIKLGRLGRVEDVMGGVVYLAGDASALMTGSALILDGGWTAD